MCNFNVVEPGTLWSWQASTFSGICIVIANDVVKQRILVVDVEDNSIEVCWYGADWLDLLRYDVEETAVQRDGD